MNFEQHIEDQFAHLLVMAKDPAFKAHAWLRAQELAASHPMYADLPRRLTEAMREAIPPTPKG